MPGADEGAKPAARELPPDRAWELKDYGLGPKPEWGTPEWFDWIESRGDDRRDRGRDGETEETGPVAPALSIPRA